MERIQCTVCSKEVKKNKVEMERHWQAKHEDRLERGEKVSYKIPSTGTKTLAFFGFKKTDSKKTVLMKRSRNMTKIKT